MTKSELIQKIKKKCINLTTNQIENCVFQTLEEISIALCEKKRVELRGFGVFESKYRKERMGRNPRTGEAVKIPSKYIAAFKVSKQLSQKLNNKEK